MVVIVPVVDAFVAARLHTEPTVCVGRLGRRRSVTAMGGNGNQVDMSRMRLGVMMRMAVHHAVCSEVFRVSRCRAREHETTKQGRGRWNAKTRNGLGESRE